ncbi:MAG: hypothetical protein LBQ66_01125 [Planctomycetaceae bacterium]|nr:hypothetical protein [Planctomycetaceae bacterium]
MAFLPNSSGFLMHRGGRDARVPVRAASRRLSALPIIGACWFCRCVFRSLCFRLAPLAENTTAQRSVDHLMLTKRFTFLMGTRASLAPTIPMRSLDHFTLTMRFTFLFGDEGKPRPYNTNT